MRRAVHAPAATRRALLVAVVALLVPVTVDAHGPHHVTVAIDFYFGTWTTVTVPSGCTNSTIPTPPGPIVEITCRGCLATSWETEVAATVTSGMISGVPASGSVRGTSSCVHACACAPAVVATCVANEATNFTCSASNASSGQGPWKCRAEPVGDVTKYHVRCDGHVSWV